MKLAVLSESPADESAIRILVDGILKQRTDPVDLNRFAARSGGWQAVMHVLPSVVRYLHYQTDADSFAVVMDSDRSPVHGKVHEEPGRSDPDCRPLLDVDADY